MKNTRRKSCYVLFGVLVLIVALLGTVVACNKEPKEPKATSFVTIDINPSIELVLDQNKKVMEVKAGNADAEVLLHNASDIKGANLEVAVENIGKLAVDLSYVSEENNAISITIVGDADAEGIYNTVKDKLTTATAKIGCKVEKGIDLAFETELNALKEAYKDNADVQKLDVARYRLVRKAMAAKFGLSFVDAVKLSNEELANIVMNAKETIVKVNSEALKQATRAYENAKLVLDDLAYVRATFPEDVQSLLELLNNGTFNISTKYVANHIVELCMVHAYDQFKEYILDRPVEEKKVIELAKMFYPDNTEKQNSFVADAQENSIKKTYTKESVMASANKAYRNADAEARKTFKTNYNTIMKDIENEVSKEHKFDVSATLDDMKVQLKGSINFNFSNMIFQSLKEVLDPLVEKYNKPIDFKSAEELIAGITKKTSDLKLEMEGKMTDAQKEKVATLQKENEEKLATFETKLKEAKEAFDKEAKSWLDAEHEKRLQMKNSAK